MLGETVFVDVNLSATEGLEACKHMRPSVLDYRTLQQSGRLPLVFLRGCGLPDRLIDYLPSLLEEAIQYYSCFISYSSKDDAFAQRLHADLQNTGVRCWFAPHDLPIGAKAWDAIDAAIKVRDKVLLILSKSAIDSDWVENEVSKALAEERSCISEAVEDDGTAGSARRFGCGRGRCQRTLCLFVEHGYQIVTNGSPQRSGVLGSARVWPVKQMREREICPRVSERSLPVAIRPWWDYQGWDRPKDGLASPARHR